MFSLDGMMLLILAITVIGDFGKERQDGISTSMLCKRKICFD